MHFLKIDLNVLWIENFQVFSSHFRTFFVTSFPQFKVLINIQLLNQKKFSLNWRQIFSKFYNSVPTHFPNQDKNKFNVKVFISIVWNFLYLLVSIEMLIYHFWFRGYWIRKTVAIHFTRNFDIYYNMVVTSNDQSFNRFFIWIKWSTDQKMNDRIEPKKKKQNTKKLT